ncbi:TetR/AcrR family transcriptional regulator [Bosea sp. (in: a-proteobacteria)]|uniref:TetR/AcrR family transcriptional regulator n=1 Tax=Bosea sp. (in: a-proteobacteria) TaxID=1871050 RepID=UPI003F71D80D
MSRPRRFALADWLALGLDALAEAGPAGLTIEALCRRAGKTKGSFYAHFPTIDAYLAALAGHWRETYTRRLMTAADAGQGPLRKLAELDRMALALDSRVEQGMRRLAALDPAVAAICATVDRERIDYLAGLHAQSGLFDAAQALALARFEYAAFVGFQQLDLGLEPDDIHGAYRLFLGLAGRGAAG